MKTDKNLLLLKTLFQQNTQLCALLQLRGIMPDWINFYLCLACQDLKALNAHFFLEKETMVSGRLIWQSATFSSTENRYGKLDTYGSGRRSPYLAKWNRILWSLESTLFPSVGLGRGSVGCFACRGLQDCNTLTLLVWILGHLSEMFPLQEVTWRKFKHTFSLNCHWSIVQSCRSV